MKATRLSFVRVAKDAVPARATLRPGVDEVTDFLCAHAAGLIDRANDGSAANATFRDSACEEFMEKLCRGDNDEFLAAADALADRLAEKMKHVGNPAPGLLVCSTFEDGSTGHIFAAVLKLEVVSDQGAVLRRLDSGEETLAAVTNVLDRPGELQKGLVFPDRRPLSQAVVGDKSAQREARYFLEAVGVVLEARPTASAAALVAAVGKHADVQAARQVIKQLPRASSGTPAEVLQELVGKGLNIPSTAVSAVADDLANADRPVPRVDTTAPLKGKIRAGALTISGPASEIAAVVWDGNAGGGWTVVIRSDTEPTLTWN